MSSPRTRLLADVMLGTLARWLRILGFDTFYDNRIGDDDIVRKAEEEHRVVLTKDRRLIERRSMQDAILVSALALPDQLNEVLDRLDQPLDPDALLSRCLDCNVPLESVDPPHVRPDVPEYVYRTEDRFRKCPRCQRIFWPGTHRGKMLDQLEEWLGTRFSQTRD
jgi:uncharacterized protein with PIN domain